MSYDAQRFRDRARDCMNLAKGVRSDVDAAMLEEMAAELLEEANRIDVMDGGKLAENDR